MQSQWDAHLPIGEHSLHAGPSSRPAYEGRALHLNQHCLPAPTFASSSTGFSWKFHVTNKKAI
jgi:hypothetical protein